MHMDGILEKRAIVTLEKKIVRSIYITEDLCLIANTITGNAFCELLILDSKNLETRFLRPLPFYKPNY